MEKKRVIYLSPQFPKRRHGFELTELLVLAPQCELIVISLRQPGAADWTWLERSGGSELRTKIRVVTKAACCRGLFRRPAGLLAWTWWSFLAIALGRGAVRGVLSCVGARMLAFGGRALTAGEKPDWIHADFASLPATVGALWAAETGLPFSFCGHAFDVFSSMPAGRATLPLLARKTRLAHTVFAANSLVAERLGALVPADRERVRLKRNGVLKSTVTPDERRDESGKAVLVFMGELVAKKGVHVLLQALGRVRWPEWFEVHIHGAGALEAKLRAQARKENLPVTFHGPYAHDDIARIFATATALVVPSVPLANGDSDGVPTVILEAAAHGVPAVASAVGAIADFVRGGETGWLVAAEDPAALAAALEEVAIDRRAASELGARAKEFVLAAFCADDEAPKILRGTTRVADALTTTLNPAIVC